MTRPAGLRVIVVAASIGCAAAVAGWATTEPAPAAQPIALRIDYTDGGSRHVTATLRCGPSTRSASGYLRRRGARNLCAQARRLKPLLTAPRAPGRQCTQIYGSAQKATVRGSIDGVKVLRRFSRTDGCGIADWERARSLLPRARP